MAAALMAPGEHVMASAKIAFESGKKMAFAGGLVGAAAVKAHSTLTADRSGPGLASRVPKQATTWVLTDRRMIFCPQRTFSLGEPLASFELASINSITATRAKLMYGKLSLAFVDGSAIDLDLLNDREADHINSAFSALQRGALT